MGPVPYKARCFALPRVCGGGSGRRSRNTPSTSEPPPPSRTRPPAASTGLMRRRARRHGSGAGTAPASPSPQRVGGRSMLACAQQRGTHNRRPAPGVRSPDDGSGWEVTWDEEHKARSPATPPLSSAAWPHAPSPPTSRRPRGSQPLAAPRFSVTSGTTKTRRRAHGRCGAPRHAATGGGRPTWLLAKRANFPASARAAAGEACLGARAVQGRGPLGGGALRGNAVAVHPLRPRRRYSTSKSKHASLIGDGHEAPEDGHGRAHNRHPHDGDGGRDAHRVVSARKQRIRVRPPCSGSSLARSAAWVARGPARTRSAATQAGSRRRTTSSPSRSPPCGTSSRSAAGARAREGHAAGRLARRARSRARAWPARRGSQ